ncbi:hypothetical protein Lser_V15G42899 [Lactuca serriola]
MVRTRSGFGNANGNRQLEPRVIKRAPEVLVAPEPISMAGVQAMIRAMMAKQREQMRQMLLNRDEPTVPIVQPELNEGQSEEGNFNRTVSQTEPPVVRRNNQDEGIKRNGRKYKDSTTCKPSKFIGKEDPIGVMDWISEMELAFITCGCKGKLHITYAVRQFRSGVVRWWNTLGKIISPN